MGFCGLDEVDRLRAFIRDQWSAGHVLASSRALLDWQHRDEAAGRYNFLLAREDSGAIVGMLGFIPTSRFDPSLAPGLETVWLTTWKVREDHAHGTGLALIRRLMASLRPTWIGTVGLNSATAQIYRALGFRVETLTRYCLLNDAILQPRLARIPEGLASPPAIGGEAILAALTRDDFVSRTEAAGLNDSGQVPRKTCRTLYERYLLHPFYRYSPFLAVTNRGAAVLMVRRCSHDDASALRIVDVIAAPGVLAQCGQALKSLLVESGAEFIDFYCSGLADEMAAAGFREVPAAGELILPSHFEPLEMRNVELPYSLFGPAGRTVICKGDADQDRPNHLTVGGHGRPHPNL